MADFGLSKAESLSASLTLTGSILGTPCYVAPEQTRPGDGRDTAAVDIYGLGAILYELLAGRPPFEGDTSLDVLVQVREHPPTPPSDLDSDIPADLEAICLRCLQKDPARRYASVRQLADDLEAFLEHRPIQAVPISLSKQLRRAFLRSPVALAVAAIVVITLAVFVFLLWREREQRVEQLVEAYLAQARAMRSGVAVGRRTGSLELLHHAAELRRSPEIRDEALLTLAGLDYETVSRHPVPRRDGDPDLIAGYTFVLDPRLSRLARVADGGDVVVHSLEGRVERRLRNREFGTVARLSFSPGGRYLAIARAVGDFWRWRVFDLAAASDEPIWQADALVLRTAAWRGGSRIALVTATEAIRVRDLETGVEHDFPSPTAHTSVVGYSGDGQFVAVTGLSDQRVVALRADDEEVLAEFRDHVPTSSLAWDSQNERLAIGGPQGIHVFDVSTGARQVSMGGHRHRVSALHFHPRGHLLISVSWDFSTRLWSLSTGAELLRLENRPLLGVSADGDTLACLAPDGAVEILRQCGEREWTTLHAPSIDRRTQPAIALDVAGRLLACATRGITLVDLESRREVAHLGVDRFGGVAFEPVSEGLLGWGSTGLLHWAPVDADEDGQLGERLVDPPRTVLEDRLEYPGALSLSRNGRHVAVASNWPYPARIAYFDWTEPGSVVELEGPDGPPELAVSDDGQLLAVGGGRGYGLRVFTPGDGSEFRQVLREGIAWVAFPAGSCELFCGTRSEILRIEPDAWQVTARLARRSVTRGNAVPSPDGSFLAIQSGDERLRLLSTRDASVFATIACPRSRNGRVAVSPDGRRIVLGDVGGLVRVLDLDRVEETLASLGFSLDP